MALSAREAAFKAISAFRKNGAWSDAFLNNVINKENLQPRDAALASRLCYGVLQNKGLCDYYISSFSSLRMNKIEPQVLDILELTVYQLVFLDKIPASAAVDEGVKLTKKHVPRAASFVNAVLRKISSNLDKLPEVSVNTATERLSVKYSHPLPLVKLLSGFLDSDSLEKLLAANNDISPVTLQINTLKTEADVLLESLKAEGLDAAPHPWLPDCITVNGIGNLENLKQFKDGLFYVQDAAARLSIMAAAPKRGDAVLDACSAPGGKSFTAAVLMENTGSVLASDLHEKKLPRIDAAAERLGLNIIKTAQMDAAVFKPELAESFDLVIADVPCSGLGIIRKKPEIRYKDLGEIKGLPDVQLKILSNVSNYVKPGGTLLYSTCTIVPSENEDVVSRFLSQSSNFAPESFTLPEPIGEVQSGMLTLYPHLYGTDGFFMCKIRRK